MNRKFTSYYSKITTLIFLFCLCSFEGWSQTKEDIRQLEEIQAKIRTAYRDTSRRGEIKKLRDEYLDIISRSKSFIAFTIGYEANKSDIRGLNADLVSQGFPEMKNKFGAIAFGYSRMNKKITGNLLFNVVPGNKVATSDYEISLRGAGATFDKGYALIYSDKLILHAFAGIGWQYHTVKQTKKNNAAIGTGLYDLITGKNTGKITQNTYHGSAGMQLDLNMSYKKSSNFGLQTGIRFAYNPIIIKGKYKYGNDNSQYRPIIDWRQFNVTLMIKIFSKANFKR